MFHKVTYTNSKYARGYMKLGNSTQKNYTLKVKQLDDRVQVSKGFYDNLYKDLCTSFKQLRPVYGNDLEKYKNNYLTVLERDYADYSGKYYQLQVSMYGDSVHDEYIVGNLFSIYDVLAYHNFDLTNVDKNSYFKQFLETVYPIEKLEKDLFTKVLTVRKYHKGEKEKNRLKQLKAIEEYNKQQEKG